MGTVISKGSTYVSMGQTLQSPDILSSGRVFVLNGGIVSSANIHQGGSETVSSGGVDISAYVYSGGGMRVLAGGIASGYYVISSSYVSAFGGILLGGDVGRGGQVIVDGMQGSSSVTKGVVSGARILSGGGVVINLNAVGSTLKLQSGTIHVSSGGSIVNTYIGSGTGDSRGAVVYVMNGANASSSFIHSNGMMYVSFGGKASSNTVYTGGSAIASSGGYLTNTVASGGVVDLKPGGSALSTTIYRDAVTSRGGMWVSSGAVATSTTIDQDGQMYIMDGGIARGSNHLRNGSVYIYSGGEALNFAVSGGTFYVEAAGSANNVEIAGGCMRLLSPSTSTTGCAKAEWVSVHGSGIAYISSGAMLSSSFAQAGGSICVMSGGSAKDVQVSSGGTLITYEGTALNVNVFTNGQLRVHESGWVSGGSVYGSATVSSGASVTGLNVLLLGNLTVFGRAAVCTVYSGGSVTVSSGGEIYSSYAKTGGTFEVNSGGTASINSGVVDDAVVFGGKMFVAHARVSRVFLYSAGALTAEAKSYISWGEISAGTLTLSSGGSAMSIYAHGDGSGIALAQLTVLHGATTSYGTIEGVDGRLKVNSGGSAFNMIVQSAGTATVSGIIESSTVRSGGYLSILTSDGLASRTYVGEGGFMELNSGTGAVVTSARAANSTSSPEPWPIPSMSETAVNSW